MQESAVIIVKDIFGRRLQEIRKSRGYDLVQAAEYLGISKGFLWKLESGVQYPSVETLEKIADYFSVDIGVFFREDFELINFLKTYPISIDGKLISQDEYKIMSEVIKAYREEKKKIFDTNGF